MPALHADTSLSNSPYDTAEMPTGSPWASCMCPNTAWCLKLSHSYCEPTSEVCLLTLRSLSSSSWLDIAQLGLCLMECIYYRGRVWNISLRAALAHSDQSYLHPFLQYQCIRCIFLCLIRKRNLGEILCYLSGFLLDL